MYVICYILLYVISVWKLPMYFSSDSKLLNSIRRMKRNFTGSLIMWKKEGILDVYIHDVGTRSLCLGERLTVTRPWIDQK